MNDQQNNGYYLREFTEVMLLGSGGFGTVFKALLKSDQSVYAVKKVALESTERKRGYNEVYFLNELNGKENIVEIFGNWFERNYYRSDCNQNKTHSNAFVQLSTLNSLFSEKLNEILHIQMQLCKMSLTDVIDKLSEYNSKLSNSSYYMINPLVFNIALELFAQIVKGLKHFHQNAIIHRDLTPGNILISADNFVKISDLGLAFRGEDDNVYDFKFKYGTHMYRPNEFPIGCYEFGTDLYSVGIIASQLFCVFPLTDEFVENVSGEQSRVICKLIRQLTSHKKRKRGSCESTLTIIEELKLKYNLSCDLGTFFNSQ